MKFDFSKSREDLQNKLQLNKLDIINKNLLYLTHQIDISVQMLKELTHDAKLQHQVDEYFDHPTSDPPEDREPD